MPPLSPSDRGSKFFPGAPGRCKSLNLISQRGGGQRSRRKTPKDFLAGLRGFRWSPAPELPPGAKFQSFTSLALPRVFGGPVDYGLEIPTTRGAIFTATLLQGGGGVTSDNDAGAWAVDSNGATRCLFRKGDLIGGKKVTSFDFLQAVNGSPGVTRAFNENYGAMWRARYEDGTSGIVSTTIPLPTGTP
jgi:hypothetical protein